MEAFKDAATIISLVGLMYGSPGVLDRIQHRGAQNVARAAREVGAKLVHFSAIGADINCDLPYFKTKHLGEGYPGGEPQVDDRSSLPGVWT